MVKYPQKPMITAADDDKHLEITQGINSGKEKAIEAARAVNGMVIIPIFAPQEQSLNPKKYSDFNDLALHSKLGLEGVKRQLLPKIEKAVKKYVNLRQLKQVRRVSIR